MVAGSTAMNAALALAEGDFVAHLDDDDECLPERVSTLLARIRETRADLVWHPFWYETTPDTWKLNPAQNFCYQSATTGSVLYHRWFARIPWDLEAYRMGEPGDWNRLRKFSYIGANTMREPTPLMRHYRERNQGA
jgi:glycosyltransferase involved in cell wall biosynthesis